MHTYITCLISRHSGAVDRVDSMCDIEPRVFDPCVIIWCLYTQGRVRIVVFLQSYTAGFVYAALVRFGLTPATASNTEK